MGAVMRLQTADKNITIIHTTPVHQLTPFEAKIHYLGVLMLSHHFWSKYESSIHNIKMLTDGLEWCGLL